MTKAQPNENEGEKRHNACSLLVLGTELQAYVRDFEIKDRNRTSSRVKAGVSYAIIHARSCSWLCPCLKCLYQSFRFSRKTTELRRASMRTRVPQRSACTRFSLSFPPVQDSYRKPDVWGAKQRRQTSFTSQVHHEELAMFLKV